LELNNLIKTKYKNKVIVIDFGLLVYALPKSNAISKQLRTEYKTKRLFYLYSIDKEFDKWEMASQKRFILDKNNFMALNYQICVVLQRNAIEFNTKIFNL
jgi:hypothetical protein